MDHRGDWDGDMVTGTEGMKKRRDIPARPRERLGVWRDGHPQSHLHPSGFPQPRVPRPIPDFLFALPVQLPRLHFTPSPPPARRGTHGCRKLRAGQWVNERRCPGTRRM